MTDRPSRADLIAAAAQWTAAADRTGSAADLDAAETAVQAVLETLGPDDPIRPRTLATLGSIVRRQWERGRRPDGLTSALRLLHAALAAGPADRALCLANLGNTLLVRGGATDLDAAVEAFDEAVRLTATDDPARPAYLVNLGAALAARSRARPGADDLDRSIAAIGAGLDAASADDPRRPAYRANLADALRTRFRRTGEPADIDRAAELAREAAEQDSSPQMLAVLGGVLLSRAQAVADEHELAQALDALARAVQGTPPQHAMRARRLAGLAAALAYRAELGDDADDLERAEALLLTAARLRPERAILVNLTAVAIRRAELTGDDARLDRAVSMARNMDSTNLATALHLRAARTGSIATLDEAARAATASLQAAEPGTTAHADAFTNLSGIMMTRYLRTGLGADLDAAVDAGRAGAGATTHDPGRPDRLSNLGNALRLRGARRRSQRDLDEAVQVLRLAARLARTGRARHLSNLGAALQSLAEFGNGDPADAPPVLRAAIAHTPASSPARPKYLSNLGNALAGAGEPAAGAELHRQALRLLPAGHPDRAVVLGNLAAALIAMGDDTVLPEALEVTREVADDPAANAQDRLVCAWRLADLRVRAAGGDANAGAAAMRAALDLAERIAWLGATAADRPYTLARFSSLALDGAAALVQKDRAAALGALENGRGVGWREQLQQRRLDALAEHHEGLARRLRAIGAALDRPLII
ncbi:hypothetical protein Dvina_17360 [Dactylosporangium vinaceum]|uniref:Tetratricopeptide repeat protein n=1 Tax=Dactylosporangium vinaceum TaxID=53362 RepID=A0ABV5M3H8_9ACTN|nr:hypothetical protein [Dactylosporangium vinaceum]UAB99678.1 hypothetical protein Dvina_17360 [Dactylosporangium vinaceum]